MEKAGNGRPPSFGLEELMNFSVGAPKSRKAKSNLNEGKMEGGGKRFIINCPEGIQLTED
jgi:hypothetical protein